MQTRTVLRIFALASALAAGQAVAHPGHEHVNSFTAGLAHPLFGVDHLLAMLAVGMWAARFGGKTVWGLPLTFMVAMAGGAVLAVGGDTLPLVEPVVAASVLMLGLVLATRMALPVVVPCVLTAGFAVFHGLAHGAEMPVLADNMSYLAGLLLSTAAIHAAGVAVALALGRRWQRAAGVPVALAGALLLAGTF